MYILGIGGSVHDFSSCLLKDGKIVTVIEDERVTRKKHGTNLGVSLANGYSRKYCLEANNIDISDVSLILTNDIINPCMLYKLNNVVKINHHLSHAASAFFCSPYNEAAILVIDSVGSKTENDRYETISYFYGKNNKLELIERQTGHNLQGTEYVTNSIGMFYSLMTEMIGFSELQEGKTMGLAPYGTDSKLKQIYSYVDINDGVFRFPEESIRTLEELKTGIKNNGDDVVLPMADYAWAAQKILEHAILNCCKYLKKITKCNNLCVAGGSFLNSVVNYKIYKEKIFNNIFIQPAAGDNGTAIGAAMFGYYDMLNNERLIKN